MISKSFPRLTRVSYWMLPFAQVAATFVFCVATKPSGMLNKSEVMCSFSYACYATHRILLLISLLPDLYRNLDHMSELNLPRLKILVRRNQLHDVCKRSHSFLLSDSRVRRDHRCNVCRPPTSLTAGNIC